MRYLTKSQFAEKLHRSIGLFLSRKDVNLRVKANKERISKFINDYFTRYNFKCEDKRKEFWLYGDRRNAAYGMTEPIDKKQEERVRIYKQTGMWPEELVNLVPKGIRDLIKDYDKE